MANRLSEGLAHHRAGRLADAEQVYRRVLAENPNHPDALHLLGMVALHVGQLPLAVELISRAVAVNPGVAEFHWNLGRALTNAGNWAEALNAYDHALRLRPDLSAVWNDVGNVLQLSGRWADSIAAYEKALAGQPDLADAWNNMGSAQMELGQFDASVSSLRRALELRPDYPEARNNLGNALQEAGRLDEALAEYQSALSLRPGYGRVYNNMGRALRAMGRHDEAIAAIRKAVELDPSAPDGHNSLGTILLDEGQVELAAGSFRRAIELRPDFAEAHFDLGRVLLLQGDFQNGWAEYEWRWRLKETLKTAPRLPVPLWDGGPLEGKSILLHAEQGFGDTIQFARYAPRVRERGGRVVLAVARELGGLLRTLDGVDQVVVEGDPLPAVDVRCPLMSLPRLFGTTQDTIPRKIPYLQADPGLVEQWKHRLGGDAPELKVGLIWSGRPTFRDDRRRSIPFDLLASLLDLPDFSFHCLQTGEAAKQAANFEKVKDWSADLTDFAQTAALLTNLNLLITVDTAAAHLAGALGVKAWVLLPFAPDWRWMLDREDSPWYPTLRLFRQETRGDWSEPLRRLRIAMGEL